MDTIGDAYVVVGGLVDDVDKRQLANRLFHLAQKMINTVQQFKTFTRHDVGIRIAIHAGPAASGVVGRLRPRFYVFGPTMREASMLETAGQKNHIHVSKKVASLYFQNHFALTPSEGPFHSYFVDQPSQLQQVALAKSNQ